MTNLSKYASISSIGIGILEKDRLHYPLSGSRGKRRTRSEGTGTRGQHVKSQKPFQLPAAAVRGQVIGLEWTSDVLELKLGSSQSAHDFQCLFLSRDKIDHQRHIIGVKFDSGLVFAMNRRR